MTRPRIPDEVLDAAHARARARAERDWPEADRLRAAIEAAGWRIVDRGTDFALSPAVETIAPVASRLDETPTAPATIVLIATDHPADIERALGALGRHAPAGTQVVVVADGPSPEQAAALAGVPDATAEVVTTPERVGHAAATNLGIRRASGAVVILLDASIEPTGDIVGPLVAALDDPTVAVVGAFGVVSADLRHFEEAEPGDVDAIEGYCLAFRRGDLVDRGPLDERFRFYRNLDIWWSLVLRDEGPESAPRRAVRLADLPLIRHEHRGWTSLPDDERDRQSKRNFYRIIDRFGTRTDLLTRRG